MKRFLHLAIIFVLTGIFLGTWVPGWTQDLGPLVTILGKPDSGSNPPNINTYVSVVNPDTGRSIPDLTGANFSVQVSEEEQQVTINPETRGIAVTMVIDRGGIARRGDQRIGRAVELADSLLSRLNVDGSPTADMVSLIGIRGAEAGGLTPTVIFTDYDPNLIRNEFDGLRTETVPETTPLYDGIDRAIKWLTDNPDAALQEKVNQRRKFIVIFSDGIDNKYSSEAHETRIMDQCNKNGISLYTVRMSGGPTDEDNLQALAVQTNGLYINHTLDTQEEVLSLFDDIVTQRQAYRITFPLYRAQGDYEATVQILDTPIGDGSDQATVSSRLESPDLTLVPPTTLDVKVPYSRTLEGFIETTIPFKVQLEYPDGIVREPAEVTYFANSVRIGTSTAAPDYAFEWNVTELVTPTEEVQSQEYTIAAHAKDLYLESEMVSDAADVEITWEAEDLSPIVVAIRWASENWWLLLILGILAVGLVILLIMLIRTRGKIDKMPAVKHATQALSTATQRLFGTPARAKLVINKGANSGREFKLSKSIVKVGRDPQFSDFALYDQYTSNPHLSIILEGDQFYIQDEQSTNGTKLNGAPIQPLQRYPLQKDAIIEVGSTQLQFKRLGGTTRQLGASGSGGYQGSNKVAGNQGGYQQPQQQPGGQPGYAGPTQPARPASGGQPQGGAPGNAHDPNQSA